MKYQNCIHHHTFYTSPMTENTPKIREMPFYNGEKALFGPKINMF